MTTPDRSLAASTVLSMGAAATEIIGSFVVGWITARQLGPEGKGEYTAIITWVLVIAWLCSVGLRDSVAFFQSRSPERSPEIFTTSLLYTVVLAAIGIGVAQLLAPLAFRAQSDDVIAIARVAFFGIFLIVAFQTVEGLLSGQHRFVLLSATQALSSVGAAVIMGLFALFGGMSVGEALIGKLGIYLLCTFGALILVLARVRPGRPSQPLARDMFGYGSKLTFEGLGQLGTTQLDLVILPAVLVASEIGFYAVATSTATVIYLIFGRLGQIVLPVAARRDAASAVEFTARVTRLVLVGAAAAALALALIAQPLFVTIYGSEFDESLIPLLILLPGSVAWSAYRIVASGLQGLNRPGQTSRAQLYATVVTLVGLALTLRPWGIRGAALTSSIAYTTAFVACLRYLAAAGDISVRSMLRPRLFMTDVVSILRKGRRGLQS
ncbi:MAG TPA: oligosaccharide flippase family protein [Actinomycetota bacterium]